MRIGIRGHDAKVGQVREVATTIKDLGFDYVQLVVNKSIKDEDNNAVFLTNDNAPLIAQEFKDAKLNVAMLGAYFNPVHSNKQKLKSSIEYFKLNLKLASLFNCSYVGTETGSYNDDKWTYNPHNHTDEAFKAVRDVFLELLVSARLYNSTILIEPAFNHVIYCPSRLALLLDELNDDKHINVTIDIYNLINNDNYGDYKEIFGECLQLFKNKISIIHLKDFIVEDGTVIQTDVGKGLIDYNYIMNQINESLDDVTCIFEGVKKDAICSSYQFIKQFVEK